MLALPLGCIAGLVHVVTGPDHLAAVSTLAAGSPGKAGVIGFRWGLGHSLGVVVLGALALVLQRACGLEAASGWSDRAVGIMMIGLGLWALHRALRGGLQGRVHDHTHEHGGVAHSHEHVHLDLNLRANGVRADIHRHTHAPYAFGILHGFGGGSHLFGVLPALAFATLDSAAWYLAGFVVGTLIAMTAFAVAIGAVAGRGSPGMRRILASSCALASCGVGGWWAIG